MFAKIFTQIFDSSIADDWRVRVVFQDMLVLADGKGIVDITPQAIARRTNLPLEIIEAAIPKLEGPDATSRTPDHDGRRIVRLDTHRTWGWQIVNFAKYRQSASKEMIRMSETERKRAYRAKFGKAPSPTPPTQKNTEVEAEAEAEQSRDMSGTVRDARTTVRDNNLTNPEQFAEIAKPSVVGDCSIESEPKVRNDKHANARIVLQFLNEATGKRFRETPTNLEIISARLNEPDVDLEGVKVMVLRQVAAWAKSDMAEYLRPETLFGKSKFDAYYAAKDQPVQRRDGPKISQRTEGTMNAGRDFSAYDNIPQQ